MKTLILPFLLILTLFVSCVTDNSEILEQKTASYDVYVAGSENNKACYWKNNLKTDLNGGNNLVASKIIVENNNVYITASNQNSYNIDYFWKNGVKYDILQYLNIPMGTTAYILNITAEGNDVYFTGYLETASAPALERFELCYWKNSAKVLLQKQPTNGVANICIANSQPYVVTHGYSPTNGYEFGYFQNTIFHSISPNVFLFRNITKNHDGVHILFQKDLKFYKYSITTGSESEIGNYESPVGGLGELIPDPSNSNLYTNYNQYYYYKNTIKVPNTDFGYRTITDMKVYDENIYMLKQDNNFPTGYKLSINDVQIQTIMNGGSFRSVFVVKN